MSGGGPEFALRSCPITCILSFASLLFDDINTINLIVDTYPSAFINTIAGQLTVLFETLLGLSWNFLGWTVGWMMTV